MAFVMTRPPSPLPRETLTQIAPDSPHISQTSSLSNLDMGRDKDSKPHIDIQVDSPCMYLKGVGVDVEPALLTGHVALYLTESTSIKQITLQFRGKARVPTSDPYVTTPFPRACTYDTHHSLFSLTRSNAPLTYIICTHDWSFLEGEKHRSHTLKAGRHLFPFQLRIGGSLPSTMSTPALGGASIVYKLRAEAVRSGFSQNLHAVLPIPIIRSFAPEALEYQQSLEIENTWPDKLMYSFMVPHKAWAAGDKLTAVVKFVPLTKGVCVLNITSTIHEQTKTYARIGTQENARVVAVAKYEIVGGKAVEVKGTRLLRSHSAGYHTPPTPPSPASEFLHPLHPHHANSSNPSRNGRSHLSVPSSPPTTQPDFTASGEGPSSSTFSADDSDNSDVVAHIDIDIPKSVTPSHGLEPVVVTHRIRWDILILNRDGHTSELRCSLPLHLLDYRLLDEAKSCTTATRRLLLGGTEEPIEEPGEVQLPSYMAHVRDRVANMFLPESSTVRVRNPWVAQGVSPTYDPEGLFARSGHSTPLEAHPFSHLPHAPESNSNATLDWVDSELLLSLSQDQPVHADLHRTNSSSEPSSRSLSRPSSRGLGTSRFSSRSASPDHDREVHAFLQIPVAGPDETYVHTGNPSRRLHSIFNASMKPFSSFSNHWIHHLSPSSHSAPSDVPQPLSRSSSVSAPLGPDPNSGAALLHRAFTEVPDYSIAARGFLGGVPPLSSLFGLPSYEEAQRTYQ